MASDTQLFIQVLFKWTTKIVSKPYTTQEIHQWPIVSPKKQVMDLLPDTQNCGLRMRRERFPRHRHQRKPLVNDPGMHHGTCVTHVPWCMSGSLTSGGGENVPRIPGACATRNFTYLARGPWGKRSMSWRHHVIIHHGWRNCQRLIPIIPIFTKRKCAMKWGDSEGSGDHD